MKTGARISGACRGDLAVVAVLYLLEQVAVVEEEAGSATLGDQRLQDTDGEVGLADTDRLR